MTLKNLQKLLIQEKFDQKGVQLYARDGVSTCREVIDFTIEDSGGYFMLGEESNPQEDEVTIDSQGNGEYLDPERAGDESG